MVYQNSEGRLLPCLHGLDADSEVESFDLLQAAGNQKMSACNIIEQYKKRSGYCSGSRMHFYRTIVPALSVLHSGRSPGQTNIFLDEVLT